MRYFIYLRMRQIMYGSSAKWKQHYLVDTTMFRHAKILRIGGFINPMATIRWSDGDPQSVLPLVNILYMAARIQDDGCLYSADRMRKNGERLAPNTISYTKFL